MVRSLNKQTVIAWCYSAPSSDRSERGILKWCQLSRAFETTWSSLPVVWASVMSFSQVPVSYLWPISLKGTLSKYLIFSRSVVIMSTFQADIQPTLERKPGCRLLFCRLLGPPSLDKRLVPERDRIFAIAQSERAFVTNCILSETYSQCAMNNYCLVTCLCESKLPPTKFCPKIVCLIIG